MIMAGLLQALQGDKQWAEWLSNNGYGKPKERVEHTGEEGRLRHRMTSAHACVQLIGAPACLSKTSATHILLHCSIAPLLKQAKAIAWDYVKFYTRTMPGMVYNETELRADFPNGARYRLFGADNPGSPRGLYFDRATEDEPADMRAGFHTTVILPALADREG
jgi:hypothetical protein